jgi:protein dithiol:quinone oxidoreductase
MSDWSQLFMRKISEFLFIFGFLISIVVMGVVLFLEAHNHLIPCSLCIFQRIAVILSGLVFLIGAIHGFCRKKGHPVWIYAILGILVALIGLSVSLRQVYLQSLPPSAVPACGPGINFIFKAHPFLDALKIVFEGSGECAKVDWKFWRLSLADWAGLYFVGLMILNVLAVGLNRWSKKA